MCVTIRLPRNRNMQEVEQLGKEKNAIEIHNLTKIYHGRNVRAVDDLTFSVTRGEIFGLLGPNGAGKTSTIKMIVTLTKATSGMLEVFGVDVSKSPQIVREMLGYVPQSISVDADLTAYENLLIFSKLSYVDKLDRKERIHEALKYMGLTDRANDLVKHFSGGMMRRLEIAQALVGRPRILLLDEPSIGLDPASKRQVWKNIKQLRQDYGTTILITTHDMAEADALCDRVAIMSAGKIAALGNPTELKRTVGGGDRVTINLTSPARLHDMEFLASLGTVVIAGDNDREDQMSIQLLVTDGEEAIPHITDSFRSNGIRIESISISKPTLDDVFMKYANRRLEDEEMIPARSNSSSGTRRDFVRHAK